MDKAQDKPTLAKKRILEPQVEGSSKKRKKKAEQGESRIRSRGRIRRNTNQDNYGVQEPGTEID